jgi:hypothetical protein
MGKKKISVNRPTLHLPLYTAVKKHTCQVRTQHDIMRLEFQFKVFICTRCMRGVGRLPTRTPLRIVSLYPPQISWGERPYKSFIMLPNWALGSQDCHSLLHSFAYLCADCKRKCFPHLCNT